MEDGDYLSLIFIIILLFFSAYFSGSETAFFSIDKFKFNQLKKRKKYAGLLYLLERPRKLLITILLGNLFVNILVTVVATSWFVGKYGNVKGSTIASVVMTLALLIFGEITPKILAVNVADTFARVSTPFIRFFMIVFTPLNNLLLFIVNRFLRLVGLSEYTTNRTISQEELKTIIEMGNKEGIINSDEREMLRSVFEFSDTDVQEIMTPRIDMLCMDSNENIEVIKNTIRSEQFSRIPVFEETVDNIIGILYVKDVLSYLSGMKDMSDIRPFLRKAYFVPESKNAYSLLRFMQRTKTHIVMVVDEYGGVEGLVTMEDIIEELVGEIHDEHDDEEIEYKVVDENTIIADARIRNDDLNDILDIDIQENNDYNTISGYIMHRLGRIPSENDCVKNGTFEVEVLSMDGNRIEKVRVSALPGKDKES